MVAAPDPEPEVDPPVPEKRAAQEAPARPPPANLADHPSKYVMMVQANEGFGAWNDIIWEMVDLSKYLNRTMVQPCVRNGCLEPCRCGAQKNVDVWDLSGYERGEDPMNLPYINYPCEPYTGDARSYVGWSYNLEVYIDVSALKAYWPHIITYDDWCEGVMKKDPEAKTEPEHNRWLIPKAYCGELHYAWCGPPPHHDRGFPHHRARGRAEAVPANDVGGHEGGPAAHDHDLRVLPALLLHPRLPARPV